METTEEEQSKKEILSGEPKDPGRRAFSKGLGWGIAALFGLSALGVKVAFPDLAGKTSPEPSEAIKESVEKIKKLNNSIISQGEDRLELTKQRQAAMLIVIATDPDYARFFLGLGENKTARTILTSSLKGSMPEEELDELVEKQVKLTGTYSPIMSGQPTSRKDYGFTDDSGKSFAFFPNNPASLGAPGSRLSIEGFALRNVLLGN